MPESVDYRKKGQPTGFELMDRHMPFEQRGIQSPLASKLFALFDQKTGQPSELVFEQNDRATTMSTVLRAEPELNDVATVLPGATVAYPYDRVLSIDGIRIAHNTANGDLGLLEPGAKPPYAPTILGRRDSLVVGNPGPHLHRLDMLSPVQGMQFAICEATNGTRWLIIGASAENKTPLVITPRAKEMIAQRGMQSGGLGRLPSQVISESVQAEQKVDFGATKPDVTVLDTERLRPGEIQVGIATKEGYDSSQQGVLAQAITPDSSVIILTESVTGLSAAMNPAVLAARASTEMFGNLPSNATIQKRVNTALDAAQHADAVLRSHAQRLQKTTGDNSIHVGASEGSLQLVHMPDGSVRAICLQTGNVRFFYYSPNGELLPIIMPYNKATDDARREIISKVGRITPEEIGYIWEKARVLQRIVDEAPGRDRQPTDVLSVFDNRYIPFNYLGSGADEQPTDGVARVISVLPGAKVIMTSSSLGVLSTPQIAETLASVPDASSQEQANALVSRARDIGRPSVNERGLLANGFGVVVVTRQSYK